MKYLSVKDVLLLHNMAIDASGGSHGLRDIGLLESAVARPQASFDGQDLYPTLFLKAGALVHSLLRNHPFVDGNKRTAMFSAMTFLELNGYRFIAKQKEVVNFALKAENEKLSVEGIAQWLKTHTRKRKQGRSQVRWKLVLQEDQNRSKPSLTWSKGVTGGFLPRQDSLVFLPAATTYRQG